LFTFYDSSKSLIIASKWNNTPFENNTTNQNHHNKNQSNKATRKFRGIRSIRTMLDNQKK